MHRCFCNIIWRETDWKLRKENNEKCIDYFKLANENDLFSSKSFDGTIDLGTFILWKRKVNMNIQIFGTKKCNDTRKAERFFKERGIKYQFIDMKEKGMSKGEFNSVAQANGGLENMVNWDGEDKDLLALIKYIADEDKLEKVLENPQVIKTPVVRNGKQSTLGYQPDIWKGWN